LHYISRKQQRRHPWRQLNFSQVYNK